MLNIYKYHNEPTKIHGHENASHLIPPLVAVRLLSQLRNTDDENEDVSYWSGQNISHDELILAVCRDALASYHYARTVLKGPFPLGEPTIAKSELYSIKYADEILKGPFKLAESLIKESPKHLIAYNKVLVKHGYPPIAEN